jgi:GT2 family glycosyltransferase
MRLAIVLVHYRAARLVARAVAAFEADLEKAGVEHGFWIVDNGSDAVEVEILRDLAARPGVTLLTPEANRGYAGGANLGVGASEGEALVVMNPDVLVRPGLTAALLGALADGAGAAGPRFYWDEELRMLLPPGDRATRADAVLDLLAARSERWAARARRRWRRHARHHWEARATLSSATLSGALLAFRREAWERLGGFDLRFPLYFEETDWLRRAVRSGVRCVHVPAAEAVHLHKQSTAIEPRAGEWFEISSRRFRERHHGRLLTRSLAALARRWPPLRREPSPALPALVELPAELGEGGWIEVSPNPTGYPAAAERLLGPGPWRCPPEVAARLAGSGRWRFVLSDARGAEVHTGWLNF